MQDAMAFVDAMGKTKLIEVKHQVYDKKVHVLIMSIGDEILELTPTNLAKIEQALYDWRSKLDDLIENYETNLQP